LHRGRHQELERPEIQHCEGRTEAEDKVGWRLEHQAKDEQQVIVEFEEKVMTLKN
jgi:hypothetical protein